MTDCLSKIKDTHLDTLNKLYMKEQDVIDKAIKRVGFQDIDSMYNELMALKGKSSDPEAFRSKALEILNSRRQETFKKRLEVIQNQQIRERFLQHIEQPAFKGDRLEGIMSILQGTHKRVENANLNVGYLRDVNVDRYSAQLDQLFTKAEEKILIKGDIEIQKDIANIIETGFENASAKYPRETIAMAKKVKYFNDFLFVEQRKAGFDLGYVDNYVMRSYDSEKIALNREGAFTLLKNSIDIDETFPGLNEKQVDEILTTTVENIVNKDLTKGLLDVGMLDLSSRSSLEARATRSRKFVFKPGATAEWNAQFGRHNLLDAMAIRAKTAGKQNALRTILGPNPKGMFDGLVKKAILNAEEAGDFAGAKKIRDAWANPESHIKNLWANLDGTASRPGHEGAAKFVGNWRALEYMRLLGPSTITATTDLASMGAQLAAKTDTGLLQSYGRVLSDFVTEMPGAAELVLTGKSKKIQERAARFNVYLESGMGAIFRYVGVEGTTNKGVAKAMNLYTRINPIGIQAAFHKTMLMQSFSDYMSKAITGNNIEGAIEVTLKRSGFTPEYYPVLKKMVTEIRDGVQGLDVNSMHKLDKADLQGLRMELAKKDPGYLGMSDSGLKNRIERQLQTMFISVAQNGVPTPGLKQQAMLNRGKAPGTLSGEMLRSMAMLKSFALKLQDTLQSVANASPDRNTNIKNTLGYITALTGMGYVALSLGDLAKGETPRDPKLASTWKDAIVKGGAGGLYGDIILQMTDSQYGNSVLTLMGPQIGTVADVFKLTKKAANGKFKKKDLNTVRQHVPFQNHLLIKPAFDYLIFDSFMDQADPQRKNRLRKRRRERGQKELFR